MALIKLQENDDETVKNMVERYEDISESVSRRIKYESITLFFRLVC